MNDSIFISGYFGDSDQSQLNECRAELENHKISLQIRNLHGVIMHSALDFADFEVIALSYELIKSLCYSGCYDFLKHTVIKLWDTIAENSSNKAPFTIDIEGIPTVNGMENVKCKILGRLSRKEKEIALEKTYELAARIESHQFELLKRSQYYNAFNAHVFSYDSQECSYTEMDIDEEVRKKISEPSKRTSES